MISSFVFNYNSRIIQEHFQAKIGNFQCNVCLKKIKTLFRHTLFDGTIWIQRSTQKNAGGGKEELNFEDPQEGNNLSLK